MKQDITALERAFQLAEGGLCKSVADIKVQLRSEGFSLEQVTGATLIKQLKELIRSARS